MNLTSLFAPLLQPLLLNPLQKVGLWAARQALGKTKGDAAQPAVNALAGMAAGSIAQVAASHLGNDKLAGQVGIPTTEQALTAAVSSVLSGQSTLDLSSQSLLAEYLSNNIVRIGTSQ